MHVTGFDRPNLRYAARFFRNDGEKDPALVRGLAASPGTGIVYCATRKTVEELTAFLEERMPDRIISGYHAGMSQPDRRNSQERFMRGKGAVIVATNAFGMGINKPDIRFVLHYNLPGSVEAYYQEAGRAGRDGRTADCVLYHSPRDFGIQQFFIEKIGDNNEQLKDADVRHLQASATRKLEAMMRYASTRYCRRGALLNYFGQPATIDGCACDVCRGQVKRPPAKLNTQSELPQRKRKKAVSDEPLNAAEDIRFEALRKVRKQLADAAGMPAFHVLHDRVMRELARSAPSNLAGLLEVSGIGPQKTSKFGPAFLSAIRNARVQK